MTIRSRINSDTNCASVSFSLTPFARVVSYQVARTSLLSLGFSCGGFPSHGTRGHPFLSLTTRKKNRGPKRWRFLP